MPKDYIIVSPCYNEVQVIDKFLRELESTLSNSESSFQVIMVDDGSYDGTVEKLKQFDFQSEKIELKVISLKFNMGHQEAIRQGLMHSNKTQENFKGLIVMDSDGEDDPEAILELTKIKSFETVFVERGKRKERLGFKIAYLFYRIIFKLITGKSISFGNYSLISPSVLKSISEQPFIHYAAFLSKQKFKSQRIQFDRRKRIDGKSKMNYQSLILHGLYSLIEYSEEILYSLIKVFVLIFTSLIFIGGYVLYSKYITHEAISGWTSAIGFNLIIASLIIISTIILGLLLLSIKKTFNQKSDQYYEVA